MSQFLIIRAGKTFMDAAEQFGEFDQNFLDAFSATPNNYSIVDAQQVSDYSPFKAISGILITGALENVTENREWMDLLKGFIVENHNLHIPIIGICFGHQIIAEALGGKIDFNEKGGEFGIEEIKLKQSLSFFGLQLPNRFNAYVTHFQSVVKLPEGAISLAESTYEKNQIVHYGQQTWGFQFHPEFTHDILKFYLHKMDKNNETENQGTQIEALGSVILDTFLTYCEK